MLTCVEICAGAGGQALGLSMAGFSHLALVEYEQEYCNVLKKNRPDWNVICADVKDFSGIPYRGKVDLFAGGVPCPPFSVAGKQLGKADERDLFPEAIRLIGEIEPKAIMLENVRGFLEMTVSKRFFLCWPFFLTFFMTVDTLYLSNHTKTVEKLYIIIIEEGDCMGESLKAVFDRHGGLMRTAELKKEGFYYKKIQHLLEEGEIEQVRRDYYQYSGEDSFSDIPTITTLFPDGVICMESALDYYGYTDRTPTAWHLAVDNKSTRTRFYIDYPIVKPHFIRSDRYQVD